jgi:hypothetical protein
LEVVDEGPVEVLLGVDVAWFETFKPSEGHRFQGYKEVECLGGGASNPLTRVLLAVVLGDLTSLKSLV